MKKETLEVIEQLIKRYPELVECYQDICKTVEILISCYNQGNKLLVCGNGGSAADSQHIVGELMKSFKNKRELRDNLKEVIRGKCIQNCEYYISNLEEPLTAISLVGETGLITAYSNDKDPDLVFAQQVLGLGRKDDVLLAISTSGNSSNIIYACEIAKAMELKVIGLTGETGGKINTLCDVIIKTPSRETYIIQEFHLPIYHAICLALEKEFFGKE